MMQVEMWHKDSKESVMVHKLKVEHMKANGWTTKSKKTKEVISNG